MSAYRLLGTPSDESWLGVSLFKNFKANFPQWPPQPLARVVPGLCDAGIDLLAKMLVYEPSKRISAKEALLHPYFNDLCMGTLCEPPNLVVDQCSVEAELPHSPGSLSSASETASSESGVVVSSSGATEFV